jgi:protein-tyrosine-phosphatase
VKLLFVCTGNINRSAAAEVIARAKQPRWHIRSAATNLKGNNRMSKRMRLALETAGYDGSQHRSTPLTKQLCDWADLIIGFQQSHLDAIRAHDHTPRSILDWSDRTDWTKVPDPHFDSTGKLHLEVVAFLIPTIERLIRMEGQLK